MTELKLTFDPMTIEHLGFKMYSQLPNAVAELVANAYDADATTVHITIRHGEMQAVEVVDDGHGMSPSDVALRYLRIGRNRREEDSGASESGRRRVAGKKGLGKLALFGIGNRITLRTKREGETAWTVMTMDWEELRASAGGEYFPRANQEPGEPGEHGTAIVVEDLQRKTPIVPQDLARSLSRLFNYIDAEFSLDVALEGGLTFAVDRDLRYDSIEVESRWRVPDDLPGATEKALANGISGVILASVKPLPQEMRGVSLYVNGRLANEPEYFGVPESSFAFSYITGYVEADYLDDLDQDVIATDRRSISWELPQVAPLRDYLAALLREVARERRGTRRKAKTERLRSELGVEPDEWAASIEGPEGRSVKDVLDVLTSPESEIADDDRSALVVGLSEIAPEYADMHWRHLHQSVREAAEALYRDRHYFHAVLEAAKRYLADVRALMPGAPDKEYDLLQKAFSAGGLDVFSKWANSGFSDLTASNIRECQKSLSIGIHQGFRNPLAHEEASRLEGEGVFTYQDCLDALSVISHLRRRIDNIQAPAAQS
ncbi:MAG TPA: TIGR02391 family protein [Thermoleophilia bacterium]